MVCYRRRASETKLTSSYFRCGGDNDETIELLPYFIQFSFYLCRVRVAGLHSWNRMMQCHMCSYNVFVISYGARPIKLTGTHCAAQCHLLPSIRSIASYRPVATTFICPTLPRPHPILIHLSWQWTTGMPTARLPRTPWFSDREFYQTKSWIVRWRAHVVWSKRTDECERIYLQMLNCFFPFGFYYHSSLFFINKECVAYGASASACAVFKVAYAD